jgi:hypothetical protein
MMKLEQQKKWKKFNQKKYIRWNFKKEKKYQPSGSTMKPHDLTLYLARV